MTTLVIKYPTGVKQVVRPNPLYFKGDWHSLAQSVAGNYFPKGQRITYEVK